MTFGEQYYLTTSNPLRRLLRNLRLLSYIAFLFWTWLIVGGRVRRARRRAENIGEKLYIDDLAGGDIMGKHEKD